MFDYCVVLVLLPNIVPIHWYWNEIEVGFLFVLSLKSPQFCLCGSLYLNSRRTFLLLYVWGQHVYTRQFSETIKLQNICFYSLNTIGHPTKSLITKYNQGRPWERLICAWYTGHDKFILVFEFVSRKFYFLVSRKKEC